MDALQIKKVKSLKTLIEKDLKSKLLGALKSKDLNPSDGGG